MVLRITQKMYRCFQVPLDYSLREYVKVMFLVPKMSISVQGSRVGSLSSSFPFTSTIRVCSDLLAHTAVNCLVNGISEA